MWRFFSGVKIPAMSPLKYLPLYFIRKSICNKWLAFLPYPIHKFRNGGLFKKIYCFTLKFSLDDKPIVNLF